VWCLSALLNIHVTASNGIGNMLACFLVGVFGLSSDESHAVLEKHRWLFFGLYIGSMSAWAMGYLASSGIHTPLAGAPQLVIETFNWLAAWTGCLMTVGLSRRYVNRIGGVWGWLRTRAFSLYVFHMAVLVPAAYYTVGSTVITSKWLRFIVILTAGSVGGLLLHEIVRRIPGVAFLFALSGRQKKNTARRDAERLCGERIVAG
jgi:peptidoglycan/LPS O-acetylase OafA/YrhL